MLCLTLTDFLLQSYFIHFAKRDYLLLEDGKMEMELKVC